MIKIFVTILGLMIVVQGQYNNRYNPQYNPQYNYNNGRNWAILRQNQDSSPDGSYSYSYDTENGISVSEQGQPKSFGPGNQVQVVKGQYSYPAPDGTPITVTYYADENGFHASGAHLPTPPAIPLAIQRSLAYNAANPEPQTPYRRY